MTSRPDRPAHPIHRRPVHARRRGAAKGLPGRLRPRGATAAVALLPDQSTGLVSGAEVLSDEATAAHQRDRALKRGGVALIANGAATGLLGLLFWILAARLFGAVTVGRNSALISAMLTISGLVQLNYTRSLSGLLPRAGAGASRLIQRVYLIVCALSVVLGVAFAAFGPSISSRFAYLRPAAALIPLFSLSVALWSIFSVEDGVLASVRRAGIIPVENGVFGLLKLGLLAVFYAVGFGRFSIFIASVIPLVLVVPPVNIYIFKRAIPSMPPAEDALSSHVSNVELLGLGSRSVRRDFVGYIFWQLGTSPLPILVLAVLGPRASATFYLAIVVGTAIDLLSLNIGNTITAEIARSAGRLTDETVRHLYRTWLLVLFGSLVIAIFAPQILALFGRHYHGSTELVLRLLAFSAPARSAMFLVNAVGRARDAGTSIMIRQAVAAVGTIVLGLVLMPHLGVVGMAVGWMISSFAAGLLAVIWIVPYLRGSRGIA